MFNLLKVTIMKTIMKTVWLVAIVGVSFLILKQYVFPNSPKLDYQVIVESISKDRLVLGKKISIKDNVRIQTAMTCKIDGGRTIFGFEVPLDDKELTLEETFYIEEGYLSKNIISGERQDTIRNNQIVGSNIIIKLPLPDTIQFFGINRKKINNSSWNQNWVNPVKEEAILDSLFMVLRKDAYWKWKTAWAKSLTENLELTAYSISNYIFEASRISDFEMVTSITTIFDFENEGKYYYLVFKCNQNGVCELVEQSVNHNS